VFDLLLNRIFLPSFVLFNYMILKNMFLLICIDQCSKAEAALGHCLLLYIFCFSKFNNLLYLANLLAHSQCC